MKQLDKIVKGIVEPKDINVLWLDTNDPKSPTLKAYADGEWKAISSGEGGGGGSAEGAVSYEPQELTDEQKTQARKNQGLYASESEGFIKSISWDGDTTGLTPVVILDNNYYRISDFIDIGGLSATYKMRYLDNQQDSECLVHSSVPYGISSLMTVTGYNDQSTTVLFADNFENTGGNEQLPDSLDGIYVTSDFRELNYLDTISWDCNPDGRDQFTFTVDDDGYVYNPTYIKMADASDGILKRFATSFVNGETETTYGAIELTGGSTTEQIIDSIDIERGGFLLQRTNQGPVLKSGYARVAETLNGSYLFVLIDAVLTINGEDTEPKNGIYVDYYIDEVSSEPSTTRSFSFLPYNKIYNKIEEEYLDVNARAFDVEFFIGQDQLIECNTSHSQIFNAIKNGRVIRAFLTDYSGNEILITSDIIIKPAGG